VSLANAKGSFLAIVRGVIAGACAPVPNNTRKKSESKK
jgi:hypothetical protein